MKKLSKSISLRITVIALLAFAFTIQAFGQDVTTPRPVSPAAELKQTIGLTDITVNYSRPRVTLNGTDRSGKIWGQLVPYGFSKINFACNCEIPWRAGANENTTITFTDDVKIEGKSFPAGTYGLHMAIYEGDKATLIFSKNHTSWGSFFYDPKDDFMRIDIKTTTVPHTEVLTYSFIDMGTDYAVLALDWEKKRIPFKIEVDVHKVVLANFRNELRSLPGFFSQGFQTAANYCLNNNINQEEALQWSEIAVQRNKSFPTLATKAGLLGQMGNQAESDKVWDEAIPLGTKQQLNTVGYQLLGLKRYKKAIDIFKANVEKDPNDPNSYDSLGEAYKIAGDKENAVKNLRKALSMNPPPNVKANSEKLLKELGEKL
jgi:hypothetical protein